MELICGLCGAFRIELEQVEGSFYADCDACTAVGFLERAMSERPRETRPLNVSLEVPGFFDQASDLEGRLDEALAIANSVAACDARGSC